MIVLYGIICFLTGIVCGACALWEILLSLHVEEPTKPLPEHGIIVKGDRHDRR